MVPNFKWSMIWNKDKEKFWVIVYNEERIIHHSELIITEEDILNKKIINIKINKDDAITKYKLLLLSDTWFGAEQSIDLN